MSPRDNSNTSALRKKLLADLNDDNSYFDQVVDMFPAIEYIKELSDPNNDNYNPHKKYYKGQAKDSKELKRAKLKREKNVFDPAQAETTSQIKKRMYNGIPMPINPSLKESKSVQASKTKPSGAKGSNGKNNDDKKSRIEALREKLRAKLAEQRGNRPADANAVSKRAARRAEKKRKKEEAIKRKKKSTSNAERDNSKRLKLSSASAGMVDPSADLAQMDFGRLSGLAPVTNGNYTEVNKALKNLSKTKNLEKMLADAESKKQRLEELKNSDRLEDREKAANIAWGDALKEADGKRVKDDPAKIKKALKRKAAKKFKSAKAWKSRMDSTKERMDERQKIRNHNLGQRKLGGSAGANLSSKRIELENETNDDKPKGRRLSRAGFEGKRKDFLNKNWQ